MMAITTAMILAAGKGERMRPLTEKTPKPLLLANNKPLIVHHIERLVAAGIKHIVINLFWLGEQIPEALGDGSQFGVSIRYVHESPLLETAGGIANALPLLKETCDEAFWVVNGDVWTDIDFAALSEQAPSILQADDQAALVMVDNPEHHPEGDFLFQNTRLVHTEKNHALPRLTYSGIGLYRLSMFDDLPIVPTPLGPILRQLIKVGRLAAWHHQGVWSDIGTPERLMQLNTQLEDEGNRKNGPQSEPDEAGA